MSQPLFSVIVPTCGRPTLARTLRRLQREDKRDIEVIVVSDGPQPSAELIARRYGARFITGPETRNFGNAQRMVAIENARGRYLVFIDDDDVHRRGAFDAIRAAVHKDPERIIVFRIRWWGRILWTHRAVEHRNVSTQMFLIPNVPGKVGSWLTNDHYASDLDFIRECIAKQGEPVWDESVIALAPPNALLMKVKKRVPVRSAESGDP